MREPLSRFLWFPRGSVYSLSVAPRVALGVWGWSGKRESPQDVLSFHSTPERPSLFESHRQRRWLTRWSYRWCWWLRTTALSYEPDRRLTGTVEADDLYHIGGHKGQAKQVGPKPLGRRPRCRRKQCEPGRGHYDKDPPALIAWVSRQGAVVIQATKDFTVKTVQKTADLAVQAGSHL